MAKPKKLYAQQAEVEVEGQQEVPAVEVVQQAEVVVPRTTLTTTTTMTTTMMMEDQPEEVDEELPGVEVEERVVQGVREGENVVEERMVVQAGSGNQIMVCPATSIRKLTMQMADPNSGTVHAGPKRLFGLLVPHPRMQGDHFIPARNLKDSNVVSS
jgi:type 1 glutamine amidotransferase